MQNNLVNIQDLSEQEQVLLMDQLRDAQIERVEHNLSKVKNQILSLKGDMKTMQNQLNDTVNKIDKVISVTDVIGFGYHSKKRKCFQRCNKSKMLRAIRLAVFS